MVKKTATISSLKTQLKSNFTFYIIVLLIVTLATSTISLTTINGIDESVYSAFIAGVWLGLIAQFALTVAVTMLYIGSFKDNDGVIKSAIIILLVFFLFLAALIIYATILVTIIVALASVWWINLFVYPVLALLASYAIQFIIMLLSILKVDTPEGSFIISEYIYVFNYLIAVIGIVVAVFILFFQVFFGDYISAIATLINSILTALIFIFLSVIINRCHTSNKQHDATSAETATELTDPVSEAGTKKSYSSIIKKIVFSAFSVIMAVISIVLSLFTTIYPLKCEYKGIIFKRATRKIYYEVTGCNNNDVIFIPSKCKGLTVIGIGDNAFFNKSVTEIRIAEGLKYIGVDAFHSCRSLSLIYIPESLTNIGSSAFENCTALESVIIPSSVSYISNSTFKNCKTLNNVTISSGIKKIQASAFENCTALEIIVIPENVKNMEDYVFQDSGLKDIYCEASYKPKNWSASWNGNCNATVHWGGTWHYVDGKPVLNN